MTLHFRRMRKYHPRRTQKEIKLAKENLENPETKKLLDMGTSSKNQAIPPSRNLS